MYELIGKLVIVKDKRINREHKGIVSALVERDETLSFYLYQDNDEFKLFKGKVDDFSFRKIS